MLRNVAVAVARVRRFAHVFVQSVLNDAEISKNAHKRSGSSRAGKALCACFCAIGVERCGNQYKDTQMQRYL